MGHEATKHIICVLGYLCDLQDHQRVSRFIANCFVFFIKKYQYNVFVTMLCVARISDHSYSFVCVCVCVCLREEREKEREIKDYTRNGGGAQKKYAFLEKTYRYYCTQTKLSHLCNQNSQTISVPGLTKDDILFILSLYNDIRINFFGEIHTIATLSSDYKKELLESLWDLEVETHVGNTLRN